MKVEQIYDKGLAHASYAIYSDGKVALVDPGRDPQPYIDFAKANNGEIVAVFETHPHADFASSHYEFLKKFNATIYVNPKMGVKYEHVALEDGEEVQIGKVKIVAKDTPGHSPDHNSYLLLDENGKEYAVFTGDSLFIGDVGRPDLREGAGNINMKKEELANLMYGTIRNFYQQLNDEVLVYPAHGAGSFCGKNMSKDTISTIGKERERNWAMTADDKESFVQALLEGQPVIPKYFPFDVELNRNGAESLEESIAKVKRIDDLSHIEKGAIVVDARPADEFKNGHRKDAINIPDDTKFETWLGSLIAPDENYYLIASDEESLNKLIKKSAKIGYEKLIAGATVTVLDRSETGKKADPEELEQHQYKYTIVDVRDKNEVEENKPFESSIHIPLIDLRERVNEIPANKPVVVHCAAGYRSSIASSIIEKNRPDLEVLDLSFAIKDFLNKKTQTV